MLNLNPGNIVYIDGQNNFMIVKEVSSDLFQCLRTNHMITHRSRNHFDQLVELGIAEIIKAK